MLSGLVMIVRVGVVRSENGCTSRKLVFGLLRKQIDLKSQPKIVEG